MPSAIRSRFCGRSSPSQLFAVFLVISSVGPDCLVSASDFMVQRPPGYQAMMAAQAVRADLDLAMGSALGHGHGVEEDRLFKIREALSAMFKAFPKNSYGRIERPMLRYMVHRYFAQHYSIKVKGLEPSRNSSDSAVGAEILLDQVPAYAESILEGKFAEHGFGLENAVVMVATLEQLVLGSGSAALAKSYVLHKQSTGTLLSRASLDQILETFVLQWMIGDGAEIDGEALLNNRAQIEEGMPKWGEVTEFAKGEARRYVWKQELAGRRSPFSELYSFEDVQNIVRGIISGFGIWWEQECQGIKKNLMMEDPENSGRVRLTDFYRRNMEGEWRFGESEAYLRELGALDSSSFWHGPQVIIPNYLQGESNCIVPGTYYRVCCVNECEALVQRVEEAVEEPVATPERILQVVQDIWELEGVTRRHAWGTLESRLHRIAETHQGKVPLHGRLFGQWMHYAFPQECPFPQRAGATRAQTPEEFGDHFAASAEEIKLHVGKGKRSAAPADLSTEERWGMSQWHDDEELFAEYAELQPSRLAGACTGLVGFMAMTFMAFFLQRQAQQDAKLSDLLGSFSTGNDVSCKKYMV